MQRIVYVVLSFLLIGCAASKKAGREFKAADEDRIAKLRETVAKNPHDFESYFGLGQLFALKGDTTKSISYLDSALAISPNFEKAKFVKGDLLFNTRRAKESYREFISLLRQDTSATYVKRIGATIGVMYAISQVHASQNDEANPSYSPSGKKVVFQSNRNHNWDIFMLDLGSGEVTQITKNPLNDEAPIFASEEVILFTRQQSANGLQRDIYSYNLKDKSENSVILNPADDWYPAFSSLNRTLFFVSDRVIETYQKSKIFRLNKDTEEIMLILYSDADYGSPWPHPQKEEFLYTMKNNGHYLLYQCGYDGKNVKRLSSKDFDFGGPKYSPDGQNVVFFSNKSNNFDIFELDLATDQVTRLTGHEKSDLSPSYSPDGKKIVFYSNRTGKYQIYELNLEKPFARQQLIDWLNLALQEK